MKTKDFKKTKGITLISLVVSIVVLLILTGVSIVTLTGDNGLLMQVQNAKEKTEVAKFKDEVQLAYMNAYAENGEKGTYIVSMEDLLGKLYIDHPEYNSLDKIVDGTQGNIASVKAMWEGKEVNETNGVLISKSGTERIDIILVGSTGEGVTKFVLLDGKYYEIILNENGVKLGEAQDSIQQSTTTLNAQKITGLDSVTVTNENKKVTLQAVNSTDTGKIKITYGVHEVTVKVDVKELYTVSFYKESGDSTTYATKKVEANQAIGSSDMPANPTKDNCTFVNWKVGSTTFDGDTVISENTSVYAVWEILGFEVTHPANAIYSSHFGKIVIGYTEEGKTALNNTTWRLFYADGSYAYLIADSIGKMKYTKMPGFGISEISALARNFNPKFTSWTAKAGNSNIKAVAAMLDTSKWEDYKKSDAEWAVGGPTVEMFIASYNATHTLAMHTTDSNVIAQQLECTVDNENNWMGYKVRKSTESSFDNIEDELGNTSDLDKSIYCNGDECTYFLASPSAEGHDRLMFIDKYGYLNNIHSSSAFQVRPLVSIPISEIGFSGDNKTITITDNYFNN